jgi:predicted nucleotidyltransferase
MSRITYEVRDGKARYEGRTLSEWVPVIVENIVRAAGPVQVLLFGSVARGDDGPDSDIDVMVLLDSLDYAKRHDVEADLRSAIHAPVPVQVFVTDERECQRRKDVIGSMHYWPLREGRVVYARAA